MEKPVHHSGMHDTDKDILNLLYSYRRQKVYTINHIMYNRFVILMVATYIYNFKGLCM